MPPGRELLDDRMRQYLIVFAMSMTGATLGYFAGGKGATASSSNDTFLGLSIQLGGLLVGFVVLWQLSTRFLDRRPKEVPPEPERFKVRLKLKGSPAFSKNDSYQGECTITRIVDDSETSITQPTKPIIDSPPLLELNLNNIMANDMIEATVTNDDGVTWRTAPFFLLQPLREANTPKDKSRRVGVAALARTTGLTQSAIPETVQGPRLAAKFPASESGGHARHAGTVDRQGGAGIERRRGADQAVASARQTSDISAYGNAKDRGS